MGTWIMSNMGTILVSIILIAVVTGIILFMRKEKKQGKSTCGGNCAHCKMCAGCNRSTSERPKWKKIQ